MNSVLLRGSLAAVILTSLTARGASVADAPMPDAETSRAADQLRHGDIAARMAALQQISRIGSRAIPVVPDLIRALGDGEPRVRVVAARILGGLGREASEASAPLIGRLADPDPDVRLAAARALIRVPTDPETLVPAVLSARDRSERFTKQAVELLAGAGPRAVPAAIEMLASGEPDRVIAGARIVQSIGDVAAPAVGPLLTASRGADRSVRAEIAVALHRIGPVCLSLVIEALRDPDPKVRGTAARAIAWLGFRAAPTIPALIAALVEPGSCDDPNIDDQGRLDDDTGEPSVDHGYHAALVAIGPQALRALVDRLESPRRQDRVAAIRAVAAFRQTAEPAVPELVRLLARPGFRVEAAEALGWIGFPAHGSAPMLVTLLKHRDIELRCSAARALGRMGLNGASMVLPAVKGLTAASRDDDPRVRLAAARSLAMISQSQLSELIPLTQDPDTKIRSFALDSLANRRSRDAGLQAMILAAMRDPEPRVRRAAALATSRIDVASNAEVAGLLSLLADPVAAVRAEAASKLAFEYGDGERWVFPENRLQKIATSQALAKASGAGKRLRDALEDPERRVRAAAVYALMAFPGEAAETVPALVQRLRTDPAPSVRVAAAQALGQFGPTAAATLPALLDALGDPSKGAIQGWLLTTSVARSIRAIRPESAGEVTDRLLAALDDPRPVVREIASRALSSELPLGLERLCRRLAAPGTSRTGRSAIVSSLLRQRQLFWSLRQPTPAPVTSNMVRANLQAGDALRASIAAALPVVERIAFDLEADDELRRSALELAVAMSSDPDHRGRLALEVLGRCRLEIVSPLLSNAAFVREIGLDTLIAGMGDPDREVRTIAAFASWIPFASEPASGDPAAPWNRLHKALTHALDDTDPQVRWAAAWTLGMRSRSREAAPERPEQETIQKLETMLRDGSARLRPGDWYLIPDMFRGPPVVRVVAGRGPRLRIAAARALGACSAGDDATGRELVDAIDDEQGFGRWAMIRALGQFGPAAPSAVKPLLGVLERRGETARTDEMIDRHLAIEALGKIGKPAREALPVLLRAMEEPDPLLCNMAARVIVKIAPDDPATIPALSRAMHDRYRYYLADVARSALIRVGRPVVPVLIEDLSSIVLKDRAEAAAALGSMGAVASPALPHLKKLAESASFDLRQIAIHSIEQIEAAEQSKPVDVDEDLERIQVPGSQP